MSAKHAGVVSFLWYHQFLLCPVYLYEFIIKKTMDIKNYAQVANLGAAVSKTNLIACRSGVYGEKS